MEKRRSPELGKEGETELSDIAGTSFEMELTEPGMHPVHVSFVGTRHVFPLLPEHFAHIRPTAYAIETHTSDLYRGEVFGRALEQIASNWRGEWGADIGSVVRKAKREGKPIFRVDIAGADDFIAKEKENFIHAGETVTMGAVIALVSGLALAETARQQAKKPDISDTRRSFLTKAGAALFGASGVTAAATAASTVPLIQDSFVGSRIREILASGENAESYYISYDSAMRAVGEVISDAQHRVLFGRENAIIGFRNLVMTRLIHRAADVLGEQEHQRLMLTLGAAHHGVEELLKLPKEEIDRSILWFLRKIADEVSPEDMLALYESISVLQSARWIPPGYEEENGHWDYTEYRLDPLPLPR